MIKKFTLTRLTKVVMENGFLYPITVLKQLYNVNVNEVNCPYCCAHKLKKNCCYILAFRYLHRARKGISNSNGLRKLSTQTIKRLSCYRIPENLVESVKEVCALSSLCPTEKSCKYI